MCRLYFISNGSCLSIRKSNNSIYPLKFQLRIPFIPIIMDEECLCLWSNTWISQLHRHSFFLLVFCSTILGQGWRCALLQDSFPLSSVSPQTRITESSQTVPQTSLPSSIILSINFISSLESTWLMSLCPFLSSCHFLSLQCPSLNLTL